MNQNVEKFQQMLSTDDGLRNRLQEAADAYDGNKADDRAVFESIILPAAHSAGVEFTYEDALEAAGQDRELTDDELAFVAGGAGSMYHRLVSGVLAATLAFGSIPVRAFAQQGGANGGAAAQTEQVVDLGDPEAQAESQTGPRAVDAGAYNRSGTYTVTLREADFAKAEGEEAEGEEEAIELGGQAGETKNPAFADVRAEDVKVSYDFVPEGDGAQAETREATVNALSNDGGALTLSFTDPDASANATGGYAVTVGSLKLVAHVAVEVAAPKLSVESGSVKSDSESCDVRIRVADGAFAPGISAGDVTLGGSFREMAVTGVEAAGDTLTAHLSGSPARDYETEATWVDGQVKVAADGFENSPVGATAYVGVDLPDEAFDLGGAEALPAASVAGEAEYVGFDGNTAKATLGLWAEAGTFGDVKLENIALEDGFAGGRVESVSREGDDRLRVEVSFPRGGEPEDDYLYAGTLRFSAGAMSDERGQSAREVSTTMLLSPEAMGRDGNDAEDAAKKAEEAKKKAQEAKAKRLGGIGEGFKYAAGWVEKVDPTLAKVMSFGSPVFGMASSYVKGDWLDVAKGGVGMLQMCGLIPAGEKEVTAKDVLEEVKSLRTVVDSIDLKTTDISKEDREDRYTQTSVRLKQMQDRIASAYVMFQKAAEMLATRTDNPMKAPAANASNDEAARYNNELRSLMLQEQKKAKEGQAAKEGQDKSSMFIDVEETVSEIRKDLSTVCKWASIDKKDINAGANPIDVLDKLVSMKFNWDTQGYYARAAFRGELDATIKDAWAVVSTFYGATDPAVSGKYQPELDNVKAALRQIASRPAGQSPEEVRKLNQEGKEINVYSPSLGYAIKGSRHVTSGYAFGDPGKHVTNWMEITRKEELTLDDQIARYRDRLFNGDVWEDLRLAGLDAGDPYRNEEYRHMFNQVGIGFRQDVKRENAHSYDGTFVGYEYEFWVMGLRPDKSMGTRRVMDISGPNQSAKIYAHFYWFDRR